MQTPHPGVIFQQSTDGAITGEIVELGRRRSLASKRRPLAEARAFAQAIDLEEHGAIVVLGFGLGHHAGALAERLTGGVGAMVIFEPDLALLRATLERIDHSLWIASTPVVFIDDPSSPAGVAQRLAGMEPLVALGVHIAEHAPSAPRIGPDAQTMTSSMTRAIRAIRTTLTTTLVQVEPTLRNLLMNLDRYTTCGGIAALSGAKAGKPAVVVSAGPSLRRNIELLARPEVRDRVTIIAVQTALKPLLEAGVKPHFVTALDHHEISVRFYENLTSEDVEGVTLVAEPKANPAILGAFPGEIRLASDAKLDMLLGDKLAREMGPITPGATVAHLAYLLARHMGCDPVILIGQDLAFTDNLYYGQGAAIHHVWAGELGEFRTLEMLEWERIARGKHLLSRLPGVGGEDVYTDEQLSAYLTQFEQMFQADLAQGCVTIDATEGGALKQGAQPMALADALGAFANASTHLDSVPALTVEPSALIEPGAIPLPALRDRLRVLRLDSRAFARKARKAAALLREMRDAEGDHAKVNALIERVNAIRDEVEQMRPVFDLVQYLSQTAALNRFKADRAIRLARELNPQEVQRRQIERDIQNVTWLGDAGDHLAEMLTAAAGALEGKPKITRDVEMVRSPGQGREQGREQGGNQGRGRDSAVAVFMRVDPDRSSLGTARDLALSIADGRNALELTLARISASRRVRRVILATNDPERVRTLTLAAPANLSIEIIHDDSPTSHRARAIGAGRLPNPDTWRGGLAGLTVYDELLDPSRDIEILEDAGVDRAVLIGCDWCCVDPALIDACVGRSLEREGRHRLVFTQAAPGLAPAIIETSLVRELASGEDASVLRSIAGLLGYVPQHPRSDPIARTDCVQIPVILRDLHMRAIPDSPARRAWIARAIDAEPALQGEALAQRLGSTMKHWATPRRITLELCSGRATRPLGAEPAERAPMTVDRARAIIRNLASTRPDAVLTFGGAGDPLRTSALPGLVRFAKEQGVACTHVITDLLEPKPVIDALLDAGPDIVSVRVHAADGPTYASITGADRFEQLMGAIAGAAERVSQHGSLPRVWIVPRLTRLGATLKQIESAYEHFLNCLGVCVIDPAPRGVCDRVEPLRPPAGAQARLQADHLLIQSDGRAFGPRGEVGVIEGVDGLERAWRSALALQRAASGALESKPRVSQFAERAAS